MGEFTWIDLVFVGIIMLLCLLLWLKKHSWSMKKLPASQQMMGYNMIYADQKQDARGGEDFGKVLYSAAYELRGKPDYIFRKRFGKALIPVEIKSGSIGGEESPHRGDLLQLGVYFLILEDVYQVRPKYGRLIYHDYMFLVRNTKGLRREVLKTTKEMREMLIYGVGKANPSFANCRFCICNGTVCPYSDTEIDGGEKNDAPSGEEQMLQDNH